MKKHFLLAFWLTIAMGAALLRPGSALAQCTIKANAGPNKSICYGSSAVLSGSGTLGNGPYSFMWTPSAGLSAANVQNPVATPSVTTTYTVKVTDGSGCTATAKTVVYVNPYNNLAANGNFEQGPLPLTRGELATGWNAATGSPDLFDQDFAGCPVICGTSPVDINCVGIPCNHFGNRAHHALPGKRYAGLWSAYILGKYSLSDAYNLLRSNISNPDVIEAINFTESNTPNGAQIEVVEGLSKTFTGLKPGVTYRCSLYASLGDKGEVFFDPNRSPLQDDLTFEAGQFSVKVASGTAPGPFQPVPGTVLYNSGAASPTWKLHTFSFVASSSSMTLVIESNLSGASLTPTADNTIRFDDINTDVHTVAYVKQSYIYLDDFSVEEVCSFNAPVADAGPDKNLCKGASVSIGSPSVAGCSYSWSPNYAFTGSNTVSNPVVSPSITTTYTVLVTDNATGITASDDVVVTVSEPFVNAGPDYTGANAVCPGISQSIGGMASNGIEPYSYVWTPNSVFPQGAAITEVTPSASVTYTVVATDHIGCTASDQVIIHVRPAPGVTISSNPASVCPGAEVTLTGTASGSLAPYGYQWTSNPFATVSSPFSATTSAYPSATTTFTLRVTGNNGCYTEASKVVTVNPIPEHTPVSQYNKCSSQSPVFSIGTPASGGSGSFTYLWDTGETTPTINVHPVNSDYRVTVTDAATRCTKASLIRVLAYPSHAANAGNSASVCPQSPCTMLGGTHTVSGGTGNYTYSWSPSAGLSSASVPRPSACPSVSTTYTLAITDNTSGCTASDQVAVTVGPLCNAPACGTALVADAGVDQRICPTPCDKTVGGSPTASGSSGYTYTWTPSSGLSSTTAANPVVCGISRETYTVVVKDACGSTAKDIVTIDVRSVGVGVFGASVRAICPGASEVLEAFYGGPFDNYQFQWTSSSGGTFNGHRITVTPSVNTTYTVQITNSAGCTATSQVVVNLKSVSPHTAGPDKKICGSGSVVLGTGNSTAYTYMWSPPAGLSSASAGMPTASPASTTQYTLVVTDNASGCTRSSQVTVRVSSPNPFVDAGPDRSLCKGSSVQVGSPVTHGVPPYTVAWSPSTGLSSTSSIPVTASPSVTTTYTVNISDANACTASDQVVVTVNPLPVLAVSDKTVCFGSCTTIGAAASGAAAPYTYAWSPTAGLTAPFNTATVSACPSASATYTQTATSAQGCSVSKQIAVTVIGGPELVSNGSFEAGPVPLGRGELADNWNSATGTPDLFDASFTTCAQFCRYNPLTYNCVGVPCNHFGFRNVRAGGKRYAGLWSLYLENSTHVRVEFPIFPEPINSLVRDVLEDVEDRAASLQEINLVEGLYQSLFLKANTAYRCTLWVSMADHGEAVDPTQASTGGGTGNSDRTYSLNTRFTVKSAGSIVSDGLHQPVQGTLLYRGTVNKTFPGVWVMHTFDFTSPATGFTNFIIESEPGTIGGLSGILRQSYLYVDDVSVKEVCISPAARMANPDEPEAGAAEIHPLQAVGLDLFPNPANDEVTIRYAGLNGVQAELRIVDISGAVVRSIPVPAGYSGALKLSTSDMAQGIYFCQLSYGGVLLTTKKLAITH
jgi:hypothetical protein